MPLDPPNNPLEIPSLKLPAIFFDNPGGTQVAQPVLDRMNAYLVEHSARPRGVISIRPAVGVGSWSVITVPACAMFAARSITAWGINRWLFQ